MPYLTIFTCPKPFTNPHIAIIQRNAIRSWLAMDADVEVLLLGDEEGLAETAAELGAHHIREVQRNRYGTPLVSSLFDLARQHSGSPYLAFVNTDILLMIDFLQSTRLAARRFEKFLLVGQRYDLDVPELLDFRDGWAERLRARCREQGRLHPAGGSDYFIFPRDCYTHIPPLTVGRAGWDNWMIYWARRNGWRVIDATHSIQVIHQDHDYSHLPQGKPHYRLPESAENVQIGGGKRTIFTLQDAEFRMVSGMIVPIRPSWKKFWREVEIFPLVHLHSAALAHFTFALFHPRKAWQELRAWVASRRSKSRKHPIPTGE